MDTLSTDWLTEKHLDFEYKKYVLLAYLQTIEKQFSESKLYPHYSGLLEHYNQLSGLLAKKDELAQKFPKKLKEIDLKNKRLKYESVPINERVMAELEAIIDYSLPKMEHIINEGKNIYHFVKERLTIYPIGLTPLYVKEGYFFLNFLPKKQTNIYQYSITLFGDEADEFKYVNTKYVSTVTASINNTFESIKTNLVYLFPELPNPATYCIETELEFPEQETLLPVATRSFGKYITLNG